MSNKSSTTELKLSKSAYEWSLKHLLFEGDTDLLPPLFEIEAIKYSWNDVIVGLTNLDIRNYEWKGGRKFYVPKDRLVPRAVTQFDPLDSLIFTSIIRTFGKAMETVRIPTADNRVFSYRFNPSNDGRFYGDSNNWYRFWQTSAQKVLLDEINWVVITDITDYYNQIYHHVLENELRGAKIPATAVNSIMGLITLTTNTVSRGLPVGPHSIHILAECAFNPTDRSFLSNGLDFCRYVDDIHVFCKTEAEAQQAIEQMTAILDQQQQLTLQRQKTKILSKNEFIALSNAMLLDRPFNEGESQILEVIKKHSNNDNYTKFNLTSLNAEDLEKVKGDNLEDLFDLYISNNPTDYSRISWLLRRLAQFGAPGAVNYVLKNLDQLRPALSDVVRYIMTASRNYSGDLKEAGDLIFEALNNPYINHNEYMLIVLLNLFSRVPGLNHIDRLTAPYNHRKPSVKREIIIAAGIASYGYWIKERKDEFVGSDPWLRRAILRAVIALPGDEGIHWINKIKRQMTPLEKIVTKWALQNKTLKLGEFRIS